MEPTRYDAFISYSKAADGRLAPQLQRGLEKLAKRWSQRRALRVFRDETDIAATPDLLESIIDAVDDARWFILLASAEAVASPWVNQEVEHWLTSEPDAADRLLVVLTDGTWNWDSSAGTFTDDSDSVPEALRTALVAEPRYVDLRWAQRDEDLDLRRGEFRSAIADLAAPIHGVPKDELENEDIRAHRRTVRIRRVAVTALSVFSIVIAVLAIVAFQSQRRAERSQVVAEQEAARANNEADRAEREESIATSRLVAAQSADQLDTDHALGILLALESGRIPGLASTEILPSALIRATNRLPGLDREIHTPGDGVVVALSPNGDRVAVGRQHGGVEIHGPDTEVIRLDGDRWVDTLWWSGDGSSLTWVEKGQATRYDLLSGQLESWSHPSDGFVESVSGDGLVSARFIDADGLSSVVVSEHDGETGRFDVEFGEVALDTAGELLAIAEDRVVTVWRWREREIVREIDIGAELTQLSGSDNPNLGIFTMRFLPATCEGVSQQAQALVVVTDDVSGSDFADDRQREWTISLDDSPPRSRDLAGLGFVVDYSPDGCVFVDSQGRVIDQDWPLYGFSIPTLSDRFIASASFDEDGRRIATVDDLGRVRIWTLRDRFGNGDVVVHELDHTPAVPEAENALHPDGSIVIPHSDGSVTHLSPGGQLTRIEIAGSATGDFTFGDRGNASFLAGLANDGTIVVANDIETVVIDPSDPAHRTALPPGGSAAALAPDSGVMVTSSAILAEDGFTTAALVIQRVSAADGSDIGEPVRVEIPVDVFARQHPNVVVDPTESRFAIDLGDRVAIYDLADGTKTSEIIGGVSPLAFDSTGGRLVVGLQNGSQIVDTTTGDVIVRLDVDSAGGLVVFSPDDSLIAWYIIERGIRLVDTTTGLTVVDNLGAPFAPAFINGGAEAIGLVFSSPTEIRALQGLVGGAGFAAPSTRRTVTGEFVEEGVWSLETEQLAVLGCRQANRNLTQSEWVRFFGDTEYRVTCPEFMSG